MINNSSGPSSLMPRRIAIIGGGAAGFFLALNLKEMSPLSDVTIIERSKKVLAKVEISGGGRCNCTNSFAAIKSLQQVYPRGHRLLKRLFRVFNHNDTIMWFERHGVCVTMQSDGCVFPESQDSHTIINCFLKEARHHHIKVQTCTKVANLLSLQREYDDVCICMGGQRLDGLKWLADLGHEIVEPVPSLFSLSIADNDFCQLMGTVAENVQVGVSGTKIRAEGSLLITHWGGSGPVVLKLSSYAARPLYEASYKLPLAINWTGQCDTDVAQALHAIASLHPQKQLLTIAPFGLPSRLWKYLLRKTLGQRCQMRWIAMNQKELNRMINVLVNDTYVTSGRATFHDEFVTCGGVALSSVNPATLESLYVPNLYFAGEVLDIDGITGGFNFQAAWTTAYAVARAIATKSSGKQTSY